MPTSKAVERRGGQVIISRRYAPDIDRQIKALLCLLSSGKHTDERPDCQGISSQETGEYNEAAASGNSWRGSEAAACREDKNHGQ